MNLPPRAHQAAQYLRMSTDQQDLSIDLQRDANARYAAAHALEVVATYTSCLQSAYKPSARKNPATDLIAGS